MIKRLGILCITFLMMISIYPVASIFADEKPAYSDNDYWKPFCSLADNHKTKECDDYYTYVFESLEKQDAEDSAAIEAAKGNLAKAQALVNQYVEEIKVLEKDIADLNANIEALELEIEALKLKIEENEATVDRLNQQVLTRMASHQGSMHFNPFLDFVLGSTSFSDMLRRSYGLNILTERDKEIRIEIEDIIEQLDKDKTELETKKDIVETDKELMEYKKRDLENKKAYQFKVMEETQAEIEERQNKQQANAELRQELLDDIENALNYLPANSYLMHPVKNSYVTSGFPYYPESFGGGVHLGIDYAASLGTPLYAPANGIVLVASDGCPTWGGLGNQCGYQNGGINSGGNQVHMVMAAGGVVYGMIIMHAEKGTVSVSKGDVVEQGQYLANVGSSGSSTGPHAHIELFLLGYGDQSDLTDYASAGYSLGFNCGWGSRGLNHICSRGADIPCRLDGRDYFR